MRFYRFGVGRDGEFVVSVEGKNMATVFRLRAKRNSSFGHDLTIVREVWCNGRLVEEKEAQVDIAQFANSVMRLWQQSQA